MGGGKKSQDRDICSHQVSPQCQQEGELPQFFVVIVLLDGTCSFQSSGLSTQVVSAGLSTEVLEGP
jgi:hypothetical protein